MDVVQHEKVIHWEIDKRRLTIIARNLVKMAARWIKKMVKIKKQINDSSGDQNILITPVFISALLINKFKILSVVKSDRK